MFRRTAIGYPLLYPHTPLPSWRSPVRGYGVLCPCGGRWDRPSNPPFFLRHSWVLRDRSGAIDPPRCHMAGMLMMWGDLFRKVPSVAIWHNIYWLDSFRGKKGAYYVTRHPKVRDMLIDGLPTSCGNWRRKWFFLNVESCGPTLRRHFNMTCVFRSLLV